MNVFMKKENKKKNFELAKLYKLCDFQEASKHFYFLLFLQPWSFNIYLNNKHEKIRHIWLAEDDCIFHVLYMQITNSTGAAKI